MVELVGWEVQVSESTDEKNPSTKKQNQQPGGIFVNMNLWHEFSGFWIRRPSEPNGAGSTTEKSPQPVSQKRFLQRTAREWNQKKLIKKCVWMFCMKFENQLDWIFMIFSWCTYIFFKTKITTQGLQSFVGWLVFYWCIVPPKKHGAPVLFTSTNQIDLSKKKNATPEACKPPLRLNWRKVRCTSTESTQLEDIWMVGI